MPLLDKTPTQLMNMYAEILTELKSRNIVRTYNSPVGDYAEWLVSNKLNLILEKNSQKGYDAYDTEKKERYQIKSRWERGNPCVQSRELNVIRNYEENQFNYLVIVIFDADFNVKEAYQLPHDMISQYARYSKHHNGHILIAMGRVLEDPRVINLTARFK